MDITDILNGGNEYIRKNRPVSQDMDRIMEIVLEMKAEISESEGNPAAQETAWRARIDKTIDFDSLAWQALQVAHQLYNIESGLDLAALRSNPDLMQTFVATIQAFYDGFLLGAEFQQRGGHRA